MPKKKETSSERYKRTIRQRRIFVLSVFVIVVMLCICLFTPLFGITEITVSGNTVVSSEDIIAASGLQQGENVFRINKSKAEKGLSAIAYVEQAEIKRKFPARIEIEIKEAKPDIIVDTPTQFIVTTANGRVLEITDERTAKGSILWKCMCECGQEKLFSEVSPHCSLERKYALSRLFLFQEGPKKLQLQSFHLQPETPATSQ